MNPILVEVMRGDVVENIHRGAFALVDAGGHILASKGDINRILFAHSAIKPIQALALIQSGAYDGFNLGLEELALACASHSGEPIHVEKISYWLERIGLTPDHLLCGVINPTHRPTAKQLLIEGRKPTALHHPCSGKHAAFLSAALYGGEPLESYLHEDHPTQQRVRAILCDFTDIDPNNIMRGIDGCSTPLVGMSVYHMARAMAMFADPTCHNSTMARATTLVQDAMRTHPYLVAGEGRFCTQWMDVAGDVVLLKVGFDGVYMAALPTMKAALAIKIDGGHYEAVEVALASLLNSLHLLRTDQEESLAHWCTKPINNHVGLQAGVMQPTAEACV